MKTKSLVPSEDPCLAGTVLPRLCLLIPRILRTPHFSAGTSLFWLLWVFSLPAIISAYWGAAVYLHLRSPPLSNVLFSGTSSLGEGSVQHKNKAECEGSGISRALSLQ